LIAQIREHVVAVIAATVFKMQGCGGATHEYRAWHECL
jgi:hypothetical protein